MKRTLTLFAAILLLAVGAAAQKLSYQAVVRNSANELVYDTTVSVSLKILAADGETVQYAETQTTTTNQNGLLTLIIGEHPTGAYSLDNVNWTDASIKTEITLPTNEVVTNIMPVTAVPYALFADNTGDNNDYVQSDWAETDTASKAYIQNKPTIPTVPTNVSAFINDAGYTKTQTLADVTAAGNSAGNRQLKNVSDPTDSQDAVTKSYLAAQIDSLAGSFQQKLDSLGGVIEAQQATINAQQRQLDSLINAGTAPAAFTCGTGKMVDADGNEYETVQIGSQCWTKTNLRVKPAGATDGTSSGAKSATDPYYYVNSNSALDASTYGYYYNWEAAKLACPAGWHLPTDEEWTTMEQTQTSMGVTGAGWRGDHAGKLAGEGWSRSSTAGAPGNASDLNHNASGFGAVPAGYWSNEFISAGYNAYFWSSSEDGAGSAWCRRLNYDNAVVYRGDYGRIGGFSVRCLRDGDGGGTAQAPTATTGGATDITDTSATLNGNITNPDNVTVTAQGFEWKATAGGTYAQVSATGETLTYSLTGLTASTSYTFRAFVTTADGTTSYGEDTTFTTLAQPCPGVPTVTDYDNNTYNTVQIGNQCWMKENLRTTHYADGTAISEGGNNLSDTNPFYYDYTTSSIPLEQRGYLYNWPAVMKGAPSSSINPSGVQGICPTGWHVPSNAEWTQLTEYVGSQTEYRCNNSSSTSIAKALASTTGWNSSTYQCQVGNMPASNNVTGFSAVPAGRHNGSSFNNSGNYTIFWSSTEYDSDSSIAYYRGLYCNEANVRSNASIKGNGYSVRCLRD